MIVPRAGTADLAAVAAHYDDLDELYRSVWGTNLHHGYWITGKESPGEAAANLTRLVDPAFTSRIFAKTVLRICIAYQIGAMRI